MREHFCLPSYPLSGVGATRNTSELLKCLVVTKDVNAAINLCMAASDMNGYLPSKNTAGLYPLDT
jgi:hypothetical protein